MALPSTTLNQLRVFEAVARHGSFKQAAGELFVTQAALSHHVRRLEEDLGLPLLQRLHRRIQLTPAGTRLLAEAGRAFQALDAAVESLKSPIQEEPLRVSVAPYFSARWLTPRLGRFWTRHPTIELLLHHAYQPADFARDAASAGICWGHGHWPEVEATLVLSGQLTPVCAPGYLARLPGALAPGVLASHPLFYEFDEDHWRRWFQEQGVALAGPLNARRIDDSHALRRAVLDGHGFGLFFQGLIREDLASGQLAQPFAACVDPGCAYYLTRPKGVPMGPKLQAFTRWILAEAASQPYA